MQFQEGPSHLGTTDYTIRMNYTTVPRTWVPVNKWKHHLSVHYKEYYSSGFLSIQVRPRACDQGSEFPLNPGVPET